MSNASRSSGVGWGTTSTSTGEDYARRLRAAEGAQEEPVSSEEDAMAKKHASKRSLNAPPPQDAPPQTQDQLKANRPKDAGSTRAKSSGHGKKTADKWNQ